MVNISGKHHNQDGEPRQFLSLEATAGMKRYAFDPVKQKSREIFRDRIAGTVLKYRPPEKANAFCLSGVDCVEIFEVYDPLKIQRRNTTIAERDPAVAKLIKMQVPECNVEPKTALAAVQGMGVLNLDIISIDYTGPLQEDHDALLTYVGKHNLKPQYIVHHVNFLGHDHKSAAYYRNLGGDMFSLPAGDKMPSGGLLEHWANINSIFDQAKAEKARTSDFKAAAIKNLIYICIRQGALDVPYFCRRAMGDDGRFCTGLIEDVFQSMEGKPISLNPKTDFVMQALLTSTTNADYSIGIQDAMFCTLSKFAKFRCYPERLWSDLFNALIDACSDSDRPHLQSRLGYSYISEKASPMYGEIQFYRRDKHRHNLAKQIVGKFMPGGIPSLPDYWGQHADLLEEYHATYAPTVNALRSTAVQYLGSSAQPMITRERAIKEFRSGASVDEIQAKYRGCKERQLAAWKAHLTMGTYDEADLAETPEQLTPAQAIDMLSAGIPASEIVQAWPGSFTQEQLEALRQQMPPGADLEPGGTHVA